MDLSVKKVDLWAAVAMAALTLAAPQASAGDYPNYVSVFGGLSVLNKGMGLNHANYHSAVPGICVGATGGGSSCTSGVPSYIVNYPGLLNNNAGYLLGIAVGTHLNDAVRVEAELSHAAWSDKAVKFANSGAIPATGEASATYLLGNVWFDLHNSSAFTPYAGGGVGVGWAHVAFNGIDFSQTGAPSFAFQIGGGVKYDINAHWAIDAGYRFKGITGLNFTSSDPSYTITDTSLYAHNVQIGISYNF